MKLINLLKGETKMNEEIKDLLEEEIKAEIRDLSTLDSGSKEKSTAIEDLAKLYRLRIEEAKNEWDFGEKYDKRIMENEQHQKQMQGEAENREREESLKKEQLAEQVKERYFRVGAEAAGIILPLVFYAIWMKRGFKFEETGTFTSTTFRGLFSRFKPTKK
ncbi:MAG: hypothetical protein LBT43_05020 [Prevotella sp.]|jgi:hypothetical protein|nr:hypothetical protein [Prevotella sp.]